MPLHRKVYLIGAAVCLLLVTVAGVGFFALTGTRGSTGALIAANSARGPLSSAERDVANSQVQLGRLLSLPRGNAASRIDRLGAYELEQRGVTEWQQYVKTMTRHGGAPQGSAQLTGHLTALHQLRGTQQLQSDGRVTSASLVGRSTLAVQLAADFTTVQKSADARSAPTAVGLRAALARSALLLIIALLVSLLVVAVVHGLLARAASGRDAELAQRDRDLNQVAAANEFEARLQRALELSTDEERVFRIVEQALAEVTPELDVEMLLADSSRAHFQQMVVTGEDHEQFCSVDSPTHCPAAQRGEVMSFESSKALDACPFLKERSVACSALCIPVSVSGLTVGVVHATGPHHEPPAADGRTALELVARRASDRIGVMRAFSRSEAQASIDSLTGLANRRSLENAARKLTAAGTPYAVAFGDLDHFKRVNDTYGHGAGDQALRVFAQVLREEMRPTDLAGRFGGEEFVVVLPRCEESGALGALERVRERLAVGVAAANCPSFTVSFGLVLDAPGESFDARVARADAALLEAKRQGRDRVVIAGSGVSDPRDAGHRRLATVPER